MVNNHIMGSEWAQWDLHIHTPASFHWKGRKFVGEPTDPANYPLVDEMIAALNDASPKVYALMDYWTFDGWFALKNRLACDDAPKLNKTVFPGIELRLMAPMKGRLNAHVIFSNEINDQDLKDFQSNLKLVFAGSSPKNLSKQALIEYARFVAEDKLGMHGFKKTDVDSNVNIALEAGSSMAELDCESYKQAISLVPDQQAIGFMPFDTNDGLTQINRNQHYAFTLDLFKTSPIFETRKQELIDAFAGKITPENESWIKAFQQSLNNIPRLAISGSDAHAFTTGQGVRGYGDFPSGKKTWIKALPTFLGLKQAIKEPAKRAYIGEIPPKLKIFNENRSFFIDKLSINKCTDIDVCWLDQTEICFNKELIAIIGNKGSGKSALADITAFLGKSKQYKHFSFLKENRFRGKTGEPAKNFDGTLVWADGNQNQLNLNHKSNQENIEYVKYIPQGHFEDLCNAHVSGQSDKFEKELRDVIFSHTDPSVRLNANNFDELIEFQEARYIDDIDLKRTSLYQINRLILSLQEQIHEKNKKHLEDLLAQANRIYTEHENIKPQEYPKPIEENNSAFQDIKNNINEQIELRQSIRNDLETKDAELITKSTKIHACETLRHGVEVLEKLYLKFTEDNKEHLNTLGLGVEDLVSIRFEKAILDQTKVQLEQDDKAIREERRELVEKEVACTTQVDSLSTQLDAPNREYQDYLKKLHEWSEKEKQLRGDKDQADSLEGLKHRLELLHDIPDRLKLEIKKRNSIMLEIFELLNMQKTNRENLFEPVQKLISDNRLIRDEYRLHFKAELHISVDDFYRDLFSYIKQISGDFRGEEESFVTIKEMLDSKDINTKTGVEAFITSLVEKINEISNGDSSLSMLLRKGKTLDQLYNFIFELSYITPRYTLMFQDAQIEQLSPGQRGALLLIFYLLVDKGHCPIILDQPEENLDNETIYNLLVPVLDEAKLKRQILMVTHNPNLAVVCDAEQIIFCEFDRTNSFKINYFSGAIEDPKINEKVVNVLEGTMKAFSNRQNKYYKAS
ncbi:TPA: TrlF family AAA-like ATPase [Acinetobacter baumannii]